MLQRLAIRNYALIDTLDIDFSKELNILTGETGAGKSIILGALSLLLGQRAESKYFFNQEKKCVIEGAFKIDDYHLKQFFEEQDLDYEAETVLRREISLDGKTRAFINDTPVTVAILKQVGEQLIDIHSQHATLAINTESFQLLVLDTLCNHASLLAEYQQALGQHKQLTKKLKELEIILKHDLTNDKKSCCFYCTESFDNIPIRIPKYILNGIVYVYGCFCQPECGVGFLMNELLMFNSQ